MEKKLNLFSKALPIALILIWLTTIAALVWQRVSESPQPPLYDAVSYIQKAKSFWNNVSQGWPQNPLDLVPAIRPPGTVLLSYPFGFTNDYHGFIFRSVFVPFLIWISAILIAVWPARLHNLARSNWPSVLAIFLLGPVPFFFKFEDHWGLMDGFLASLAALAIAAAGRSLLNKSWPWAVFAAMTAAFCPLVKPSGGIVFALTSAFWIGGSFISIFSENRPDRRNKISILLIGSIVYLVLGSTLLLMCLNSDYLSLEAMPHYKQGLEILHSESDQSTSLSTILSTLYHLMGLQLVIILALGSLLYFRRGHTSSFMPPNWVFVLASVSFLLIGGTFWIMTSGMTKLRHFYPFALMSIIPLLSIAFRKVNTISFQSFTIWIFRIACIMPALNLAFMLVVKNPNNQWQKISGVSMKIGKGGAGVQIADNLLKELKNTKKQAVVYSISESPECASFNCYGWYQNIIHPDFPYFKTVMPIDWQRPSTYRIPEILAADFILYKPISNLQQQKTLGLKITNSLAGEEDMLEAFLSSLKPENGLSTMFENQFCRLSKITDRPRLEKAFNAFVKTKSWRPVFVKENEIAAALALKSECKQVTIAIKPGTDKINYFFDKFEYSENELTIEGWGFLEGLDSDSLKTYILLTKNETAIAYNAIVQIRKDITAGFKVNGKNLDSSGFNAKIPTGDIAKGRYQIALYLIKGLQTGLIYTGKYIDIDSKFGNPGL